MANERKGEGSEGIRGVMRVKGFGALSVRTNRSSKRNKGRASVKIFNKKGTFERNVGRNRDRIGRGRNERFRVAKGKFRV